MITWARFLIFLSGAAILVTFFFPLWHFGLWAPQYPEGLFLHVWSSKLSGDVQSINTLNHYIGMKPIEAENLPELQYFPYLFGTLSFLGIVVSAFKLRRCAIVWVLSLCAFACFALYDFYQWEYDFGHNLSDDAPIKMEDTAYQPPLIGTRTILTITATSLPSEGGYALTAAIVMSLLALPGLRKQSRGTAP